MSTSENNNNALILKEFSHEQILEFVGESESLSQYIQNFREQKINGKLLYYLYTSGNVQELKELGFDTMISRQLFREGVEEFLQKQDSKQIFDKSEN